jgi:hypothetical protein
MKARVPALTTLIVLCASWCAPAFATAPSRGSTVLVPPLISKGAIKGTSVSRSSVKSERPMIVRLPTQAGKVSKMVATNLVSKGPSWIAKGDKYYSLCVPNRRMVSCAPIVATSVMQDIEVGALAGPTGRPLLTFKIATGTKQAPKRIVYAINYFLARTNKQVAHFNRMEVSYAPRPGATSLRVGQTSNLVDAGGGGGCSYDDDGSYDCTGGGGGGYEGGGGGGYEGGGEGSEEDYDPIPGPAFPPNEPTGECEGNCNYPSGNNNGDPDPCIDPNGNPICAVVVVPGQRPGAEEPMSLPTCRPTGPFSIECGRMPPVIGGEPQELPRGPIPWLPQSWCNFSSIFCSAGQEPDNDRGENSELSGKTMAELYDICNAIYEVEMDVCVANKAGGSYRQCAAKAATRMSACMSTARRVTDNGAHPAP